MQSNHTKDIAFLTDDPTSDRPWFPGGDAVSWLFPLLGLLAFECFADPCLSVVIACLKFGYSDFRTAWWLNGDPRGFRGTAVSLCYFTRGLYVVAMSACVIVVVLIVCEPLLNQNLVVNIDSLLAGLVMWFSGLFLGTACGGVALHYVAQHQIRVWMDPSIHQARCENRWAHVCQGRTNQFRRLSMAVVMVVLSGLSVVTIGAVVARDWEGVAAGLVVLGIPAWWCLYGVWRSWSLAATEPDECWGEPNRNV